jgi:hypothetical protein
MLVEVGSFRQIWHKLSEFHFFFKFKFYISLDSLCMYCTLQNKNENPYLTVPHFHYKHNYVWILRLNQVIHYEHNYVLCLDSKTKSSNSFTCLLCFSSNFFHNNFYRFFSKNRQQTINQSMKWWRIMTYDEMKSHNFLNYNMMCVPRKWSIHTKMIMIIIPPSHYL